MLEVQSIYVRYNGHDILKDVSLHVQPGEILAVIGPNGAGKSTLLRTISGFLPPRQGHVFVDGKDTLRMSTLERARYLAVVPQARELPGAYSVYQTVLLGRTPYLNWLGKAGRLDHNAVSQAMERTRTDALAERRVGELSGGEQQRVLLARALAQATPILLLDEPTTHLDLQHQSGLLNLVRQQADEKNLAVLVVLHDLNLAGLYADRVLMLVSGEVQAEGEPHQVLTEDVLTQVYQVPVNVIPHPDYGTPLVLPDGRLEPKTQDIHLVKG